MAALFTSVTWISSVLVDVCEREERSDRSVTPVVCRSPNVLPVGRCLAIEDEARESVYGE